MKTSLAPGSRVVTDYLDQAGLTQPLAKLGFHTVGYGCTTCIGNSGPLPEPVAAAVNRRQPRCLGGHLRQPQFRRPRQSARQGELSGQPAAGRRLRDRRHDGYRPDQGADRRGHGRGEGLSEGHLAHERGSAADAGQIGAAADVLRRAIQTSLPPTRSGTRSKWPRATSISGTSTAPTSRSRRFWPI